MLCGGSTKWVAASQGVIPKGAFGGGVGYGDIGQEIMYVCRAKASDGSVVPGKVSTKLGLNMNENMSCKLPLNSIIGVIRQ